MAEHDTGFNTAGPVENDMGDPDREPRVSDEEILSVFARSDDTNLIVTEVADELPIHHNVLDDRLDDLYERGLLERADESRGTVWTLVSDVEDDLVIPESEVETDVEAQTTAATGSETPPQQEETPPESQPAPTEQPSGPEATEESPIDAIETFDPPGSSTNRERKREALRAAYRYLRTHDSAESDDFKTDVFPNHPAAYEDPNDWWQEVISSGLEVVPDVAVQDDEWRFVGDRSD